MIGVTLVAPIIFLVIGYSLIYVIGKPVIQFVTSSIQLFLLKDTPNFETTKQSFTAVDNKKIATNARNELPSSKVDYPVGGQLYGKVKIEKLQLNVPLYFGDTEEILREGAGQFMGSVYPGELGTSLIGGHNVDDFGKLGAAQVGDEITLQTTYGNYVYRINQIEVRDKKDKKINDMIYQRNDRRIILYTCYPIDSLGLTNERLFAIGEFVSGPMINGNE
ncbi:class D sortase [Enterococcus avium]|jgi:sortase A|uniref:class D sortase n=1 Tax=Enterococcus avium TaxID=33945 RepID=UPI00288EB8FD|nr:class D sortase [Enterococcus avium]MDT2472007.1 class D sortase [Enterococcus avium]